MEKTKSNLSYFYGSFIFTAFALLGGFVIGYFQAGPAGGFAGALMGLFATAILGVMETSLSFDNAVANASVLKHWDDKWRHRFVNWGLPVAVFGMRLVFPLAIVAVLAHMNMYEVLMMAILQPAKYGATLVSVHHEVSAYGGAFLLMVGLKYFFEEKQDYWWEAIESRLVKMGDIAMVEAGIAAIVVLAVGLDLDTTEHKLSFIVAGLAGIITFIAAKGLGDVLGGGGADKIVKASIGGFIYLELLDASFSFDGVIGAFAISNELFIIALGLGIGAMFVRSMTILLVDKGTLTEYRYLEHGAFWAILALAVIMFASVHIEVPEWFTGLIGAGLIGAALISSIKANKNEEATAAA